MKPTTVAKFERSHFQLPALRGMIERRLLVNFRCEPSVLAQLLPPPFRPKLVQGRGMAGICLIRLRDLHLPFLPVSGLGLSENAAHRIAVEWDENGQVREGVFILRRDSDARLNQWIGGKLFPGRHHAARFEVQEQDGRFEIKVQGGGDTPTIQVRARLVHNWPGSSIFQSLNEASNFFRAGTIGWSIGSRSGFDGMELVCDTWRMEPLAVEQMNSSFFGDTTQFPAGSIEFDSALLMRNIPHAWRARGSLVLSETHTS